MICHCNTGCRSFAACVAKSEDRGYWRRQLLQALAKINWPRLRMRVALQAAGVGLVVVWYFGSKPHCPPASSPVLSVGWYCVRTADPLP